MKRYFCLTIILVLIFSCSPSDPNKSSVDKTVPYQKIFDLINAERAKVGAPPVSYLDNNFQKVADKRSEEIVLNYDPPHTRPDGSGIHTLLAEYPVINLGEYRIGENMERSVTGFAGSLDTLESAFAGWMSSPGHKANMLDPDWQYMAIGYRYASSPDKGGAMTHHWVQLFYATRVHTPSPIVP